MNHYHGISARGARSTGPLGRVVAAGAAVAFAASGFTMAAPSAASRFQSFDHTRPIVPHSQPLSLRANERIKVVVIMSAPSVAEVRATAANHVITPQDHEAIHAEVERQHTGLEPSIAARGGRVLARYRDALNGIKIEIARSEVEGIASLPGVVRVASVPQYTLKNATSVPFIGAPEVWQGSPAFRGEHVKIAVIDTGIDYTHANFGGPGTVAAFNAAAGASTGPANPAWFGPKAPKVKGGIDLAGDAYDARNPASVPAPDPNPLDCNGHGSHVSGTAAGFGVNKQGSTYHGPYNKAAYGAGFAIGPGVAPLADLYAVRVFGCSGSTDLVADAIDWAVDNDMDVISMSLGSDYGTNTSADGIAARNAVKAGIIVVAAAGNAGPAPYVTSDPASITEVISVGAMDAHKFLPNGVHIALSSGSGVDGIEANTLPLPKAGVPALVLKSSGSLSFGCSAADYPAGGAPGAVVIISRGTCAFTQKAAVATAAGAVAIGVVNNAAGFFNPAIDGVTIPFIELRQVDSVKFLSAGSPLSASIVTANVPNPTFRLAAGFSSGGPRTADGALKPDVTAPGSAVFSTLIGSGNGGVSESGTSMATPHVAGVAALALQAHRGWTERGISAAVVQTASPSALLDYAPRIEGSGVVQAVGATSTDVTVHGTDDDDLGLLSFGVAELTRDFHDSRELVIRNHGREPATFNATATAVGGVPHTVSLSSTTVSVRGHDETELRVSLQVPAATVGGTHDAGNNAVLREVAGYLTLQPTGASANDGISLHVPYYLVPRARSNVRAELRLFKQPSIELENPSGVIAGTADLYAWGLRNAKTEKIDGSFEPRAVGVQTIPVSSTDSILVFAVNTYERFSNAAQGEFDIYIDANGDGKPDFVLFCADSGLVMTGANNGQVGTFLVDLKTGKLFPEFTADAPTDGSIVLLPVYAADMGLSPTHPRFTYSVIAFDGRSAAGEAVPGLASFNAFSPALSNAVFTAIAPNAEVDLPVAINRRELTKTPALGFMVVSEENLSGGSEAILLPLRAGHDDDGHR